ncbi:MAG: helix-turn-helix domain-containing protein [Tepidiformaceae bacterium]
MSELGSWLIRAREARGLTLEDAERDTRISRRYLQALEGEQFEVIPAPVYARGFLRSYSQYLGLDPQEILALFPRDDDAVRANGASTTRATQQQPLSPVGASRPAWTRPDRRPAANAAGRVSTRSAVPADEPMIGIDIGVAALGRKIRADPAAQTRALAVLLVAIGAIVGMVLLALIISNVGGDDGTTPSGSLAGSASQTARAGATPVATTTATPGTSGLPVTRGVVPDVTGQQVAVARLAIQEAGFKAREQTQKDSQPKGAVLQQSPAAGIELAEGLEVRIVVSEGP